MSAREFKKLRVGTEGHVTTMTLFAPERRNAIGPLMITELLWALADAADDDAVRVVVLSGSGTSFCAGGDFAAIASGETSELPARGDYADLLLAMMRYEKPIIAKVNGHALGGGLGLVCASTFAVAQTGAKLGTPEIDVGLFPMMIMAVLARHVPRRRLTRMMLLGEKLTAAEALEMGLVSEAVEEADLDRATETLAARLAEKSPAAMRLGLRAIADQADLSLADALPLLRERLGECLTTDDAREGMMAFLEKRKPVWTGK